MEAVLENVKECASICARLEWLLGPAERAKVVSNERASRSGLICSQRMSLGLGESLDFLCRRKVR